MVDSLKLDPFFERIEIQIPGAQSVFEAFQNLNGSENLERWSKFLILGIFKIRPHPLQIFNFRKNRSKKVSNFNESNLIGLVLQIVASFWKGDSSNLKIRIE